MGEGVVGGLGGGGGGGGGGGEEKEPAIRMEGKVITFCSYIHAHMFLGSL